MRGQARTQRGMTGRVEFEESEAWWVGVDYGDRYVG